MSGVGLVRANRVSQLVRYAVVGGLITGIGQAIYWSGVELAGLDPQVSIALAFAIGIAIGYIAHRYVTFAEQVNGSDHARATGRFAVVNLIGLGLNSFFVWLLVKHMGGAAWWPIIPNFLITPLATFWMHRRWTFSDKVASPAMSAWSR